MNEYRYYLRQMEPEINQLKYQEKHQDKKKKIFRDSMERYNQKKEKKDELMEIL